ncbi:MAG TPA: hypothetical protein VHK01_19085 [Lacipirellulaceae bacterium]|jgi:hypothetical protein|nr:hypothetical protein [Lacipirellulaceae bacterium]
MRTFFAAILLTASPGLVSPAAAFNNFVAVSSLQDASGMTLVVDRDEGSDFSNPLPPNTAFTSFIGGGDFSAHGYVDTNAVIAVDAGMVNRLAKLSSRASFSLDIENPSSRPRRMNLGFLIFPGRLRLIASNAEASFRILVTVVGGDIEGPNGFPPRFEAGGTLATDANGVTTWTNLPFSANIGLPPDGPSSELINIPLRAPTLTAFFGPNARGLIQYDMSVTIDSTDAAAGGGFLEIAEANVSDPLMPPMNDAIQSITFSEVPEPGTAGLALLAIVALNTARRRGYRKLTTKYKGHEGGLS